MINSKSLKCGDVVLIRFPFTDLENSKKRPALVLRVTDYPSSLKLINIAMITSQIEMPKIEGDCLIQDWKQSGLLHPSRLRLSKVATLENSLIIKRIGHFSEMDIKMVAKIFKKIYRDLLG